MALSDRQRRNGMTAAQKLLPDTVVDDYVIGRGGPHPVRAGLLFLATAILVGVVVYALTPLLVIPGVVLVSLIHHFVSPPRAIAVTDRGVALTNRSFWHGKPSDVRDVGDFHHVFPELQKARRSKVVINAEHVWMRGSEEQRLLAAVARAQGPAAPLTV